MADNYRMYKQAFDTLQENDVAPSITTKVGMLGGSSNLLIIEEVKND